jgi:general nucleoside transport system permease protein
MSSVLFSVFLLALGKSPVEFFQLVHRGGFGTAFSIQNTLQRSAPLILTALAVAVPARIGLIMIGGEGALVLGGFTAAVVAIPLVRGHVPPLATLIIMAVTGTLTGALWVGLAGYLRHARGVNETISSLLLTYIGIAIMNFFVEGPLRDLTNPNKPSTMPIGDAYMVGEMPGTEVHWSLTAGVVLAIVLYILLSRTTFGFAVRVTGGNPRAALVQGFKLIVACCMLAGACAGLAGFFEVAAIQGRALAGVGGAFLSLYYPGSWNQGLSSGQGLMAVALVIFARWKPLQCVVAALLFGAAGAIGPALQSVGITQGYYFFNAAPYILTLLIMIASAGSKQAMRDVPGELSITK